MRYIGWKKRDVPVMDFSNGRNIIQITDLYVFNDPGLINYDTGFIGVRPKNLNDYEHWHTNEELKKKEPVKSVGIGIHKDCLFRINKKTNLSKLAEKIGIEEGLLESILSDS